MAGVNPEPPLAPYLTVDNAAAAIVFYTHVFGGTEMTRQEAPDGKIIHATLDINGGTLFLSDDFEGRTPLSLGGSPITIHVTTADVDGPWNRALAAGATVGMPLEDQFWGSRYGIFVDPFGHRWSLGTPAKEVSKEDLGKGAEAAFKA
jgi:PhnB protein